eukprot:4811699-Alexandrium_andersonii.AAC.1
MAPPLQRVDLLLHGQSIQVLYLDDRSGLTSSLRALREVLRLWGILASCSGLLTDEGKTQRWARASAAARAMTGTSDAQQ